MQNPGMPGSTSTDAKTDAMREQAQAGIDSAASTAHDTVDRVAGAASSAKDRLANAAAATKERLASAAASTKERLSEKSEEWYQQSQHAIECTRDCVRTHPLTSIGIAVVGGMLISRITSSRRAE